MPTVALERDALFKALGRTYTEEAFQNLCFDFGIELDEVTTERDVATAEVGSAKAKASDEDKIIYKIDIPANRYDLLCLEGIVQALRIFLGLDKSPVYKTVLPAKPEQIIVAPATSQIRPHIVGAVLRNITFTPDTYKSFIDLQDKLHQNICRKRTLVAIGTHDLDTVKGPLEYAAPAPKDIAFVPLKQSQKMTGEQLMAFYESDRKISKFLHIIRDSPVYPLVRVKSDGTVLSLPPIINSEHSKITLDTKNVLIEMTATDLTKANIVLNTMCAMFASYCDFTIEQVEIVLPDGSKRVTPDMSNRTAEASVHYIQSCTGLKEVPGEEMAKLLTKMNLAATLTSSDTITVQVPPTRSDVMHQADIMEDVAIAYGFNNLPMRFPKTVSVGKQLEVNKLSDKLRREMAQCGWTEVMPLILCSMEETSTFLRNPAAQKDAVQLANPKTFEYQVVRTSLLPGLMKTLTSNQSSPLPLRVFEASDIVIKDESNDRKARNERWIAGILSSNKTSGFEIVHGVVDRIMSMLTVPYAKSGYLIREASAPAHFPGRSAEIVLDGKVIGNFGVLHPEVLRNFEYPNLCSAFEICLEPLI